MEPSIFLSFSSQAVYTISAKQYKTSVFVFFFLHCKINNNKNIIQAIDCYLFLLLFEMELQK